jgi:hypothetical protein
MIVHYDKAQKLASLPCRRPRREAAGAAAGQGSGELFDRAQLVSAESRAPPSKLGGVLSRLDVSSYGASEPPKWRCPTTILPS